MIPFVGDAAGPSATSDRRQQFLTNQEPGSLLDLGRAHQLLAAHYEVHELMLTEAPLEQVLTRLVQAIERNADGMIGTVLLFDPATNTLRHGAAPSLPRSYVDGIDGHPVGPDVGSCGTAVHTGREVIVADIEHDPRWREFRLLARDHGLRACWSVPVLDAAGTVLGTFALYYDAPRTPRSGELRLIRQSSRLAAIAIERHRAHAELKRLATRDTLTELPNRALLVDRLTLALARSERTGSEVAVVFCDLDDFKLVNDSLGHELGDWVLREVGGRLADAVRPGDTVARFGGDEFVVVADGITAGGARRLAERLHGALEAPFVHPESGEHRVGTTLGIALAGAGVSAEEAIRRADNALYDAKRAGVPTRLYSDELHARATARMQLHGALRRALARDELRLHYQPIVDLAGERIVTFEALMRWENPQLGCVPPSRFIPAAEQTGLIVELGDWALQTAAAQARCWLEQGTPAVVAVNLSARQLLDPELPARVERVLAASELPAELLTVEVTETALLEHDVLAARSLAALAALGVHAALDDFGTGYSSFARLRRLPIDAIKIDREFVAGLGVDPDANAIVTAILGLAHGLGVRVTAEGVETPEQLELLRAHGVTLVQGFHLGRPQDAAAAGAVAAPGRRTATIASVSASPPRVRVLVADDHPLFREAIVRTIRERPEFELVGESADGRAALEAIRELRPDVAVIDVKMPELDGLQVVAAVRRDELPTRVLLLSAYLDSAIVFQAVGAGAAAYLSKESDRSQIGDAIAAVARGETVLSPEAQAGIAAEVRSRQVDDRPLLTPREREVLGHVAAGRGAPEIARLIHLSPATVKGHLQSLYEKLGVSDRAAAVAEAMRRGLLE